MQEWSETKKWNPFNSYKLLAQIYRWRLIQRGKPIPQPALVTVDPINNCNLSCKWCNASHILTNRENYINKETLFQLADFLSEWQGSPEWSQGVEGVCIAGGGEPLLHQDIGTFIEKCVANNIEVGVVTNGTNINNFLEPLSLCTWVGISVDAGKPETFRKLKGRDLFNKVCDNIALLNEYISSRPCRLGMNRPGYGTSYKFLLYNGNAEEIADAARLAYKLGCKNFHLRPAGISWDKIGTSKEKIFDNDVRATLEKQLSEARKLETDHFGVFGVTHKFDTDLNKANHFHTCHALFMTAVFMPPRNPDEKLCLGLCCDRRGDLTLECSHSIQHPKEVANFWGSKEHWDIFDALDLSTCPRCTYQPHNQIYEHVIQEDSMTYKFI